MTADSSRKRRLLRHLLFALSYGLLGCLIAGTAFYIRAGLKKPELAAWHRIELEAEFRAERDAQLDFGAYRELEGRVFEELERALTESVEFEQLPHWSRFRTEARPAPGEIDWNRSYELPVAEARAGALLLHGSSDSPYSLHAIGEQLQADGVYVVAVRYPGHGTVPSGLLSVKWEDLAAVVRIGARHLRDEIGADAPITIVGYSTGATLAIEYCCARMLGEELPEVTSVVLLSPAISVSGIAALASYQRRLSGVPGLEKLAWLEVLPEYDRYKFNSFAINAGDLVYRSTQRVQRQLDQLAGADGLVTGFPSALAFVSAVDATVLAPAIVDGFLARLAPGDHELVVYDFSREADAEPLFLPGQIGLAKRLDAEPSLPFDLTILTNTDEQSERVVARRRLPGAGAEAREELELEWPPGVYSMSHVALPFRPDDPKYGRRPGGDPEAPSLGKLEPRGERGMLVVPAADLLRLRYNPFWTYQARRIEEFMTN